MTTISVHCANCSASFKAKPELAGRTVRCPKCKEPLTIPELEAPAPEQAAQAESAAPSHASEPSGGVPPAPPPLPAAVPPPLPDEGADSVEAEIEAARRERKAARAAAAAAQKRVPIAFGAAFGATLVCAIAWWLIWKTAGAEFGILAWAIGLVVGFAALLVGGRGQQVALTCAVLAPMAMLGGKFFVAASKRSSVGEFAELSPFWEELAETSLILYVRGQISPFELLFAVLGAVTAYFLVMRRGYAGVDVAVASEDAVPESGGRAAGRRKGRSAGGRRRGSSGRASDRGKRRGSG